MAKTKISEFDVDPANNTDINSINIAEGCAPSGINNAIRQLMSDLKEFQTGASGDPFTVGGAFAANGGATLGDASGDALTINSSAVSIPNGLNFDSNTLVIDSTNDRVGVGTSSPSAKLDVAGLGVFAKGSTNGITIGDVTTNSNAVLRLQGTSAGKNFQIANNLNVGGLEFTPSTADGGTTYTTPAMAITSAGNVGIGTSSPSTFFAKLAVVGNTSITGGNNLLLWNSSNSTNAYLGNPTASDSVLAVYTSSAERMRIDSSGNVGIGTSSFALSTKLQVRGSTANAAIMSEDTAGTTSFVRILGDATAGNLINWKNGTALRFAESTDGFGSFAERMRIDSSGAVLIGTTSIGGSGGTTIQGREIKTVASSTAYSNHHIFANPNGDRGAIYTDGNNAVYANFSDYRLKENIAPMTGALAKVSALKPVTYTWKVDGSNGQGFIAHELQEVVPDCVVGTKDAVDKDGKPVYQGIDTSFLVATLTAAIQEQQALIQSQADTITAMEARLTALENK